MKTALCICTYRRPHGLQALLEGIARLSYPGELEIVVVDNHADAEGIAVCEQLRAQFPFPLHAMLEQQAGISPARNAAASAALALNPDFVAFLDDDEYPEPVWLDELHRVQAVTNADVVGGPTLSDFPADTDPALLSNPYYGASLELADKSVCQLEAAGNFMIRASVLASMAPTFFHPAFAHSGGEDLAFFTQLAKNGASMRWAANAIVHETVPASRLSQAWLQQRVVNIANSRVRVMQMLQPGLFAALVRGMKTLALFAVASLSTVAGLFLPPLRARARLLRWKFWGKLTAHLRIATVRGEGH